VPVVVVTGHERVPPEGADAVFRKPLDAQAFLRAVRALVGAAPRSASPRG
jgi:hypothetical protein